MGRGGASEPAAYLPEIDRLRGVAILSVVCLHGLSQALDRVAPRLEGQAAWRWSWAATEAAFHGATVIFALVSGLLFARVYARRSPIAFWRHRLRYLGVPYLAMTALFTPIRFGRPPGFGALPASAAEMPLAVLRNLVAGTAQYAYWYLPVALFLVAVAPAVAWLLSSRLAVPVAAAALLLPLVVSRQGISLAPSTFAYFLGPFVAGVAWGRAWERVGAWLERARGPLWAAALASSAALVALHLRRAPAVAGVTLQESLAWAQKLAVTGLLVPTLAGLPARSPWRWLGVLGRLSFPVYFLHLALVHGAISVQMRVLGGEPGLAAALAIGLTAAGFALAASLLVATLLLRASPALAGALLGARPPRAAPIPIHGPPAAPLVPPAGATP